MEERKCCKMDHLPVWTKASLLGKKQELRESNGRRQNMYTVHCTSERKNARKQRDNNLASGELMLDLLGALTQTKRNR